MTQHKFKIILWTSLCLLFQACTTTEDLKANLESNSKGWAIPDFSTSPYWGEQIKEFVFEPGIKAHINAPSKESFNPSKPTQLVFYALPNGNTIPQTIGKVLKEGDDWHFDIQHIGAQIRRLREVSTNKNLVVVYLEAEGKSWPSWRKNHSDNGIIIASFIEEIKKIFEGQNLEIELSSHSGGGSFIFGFINQFEDIPDEVKRIVFLDSNYGFSTEDGHGVKLLNWLKRDSEHHLVVIAYDDREITLDGKKVVSPTGGTYRATYRMMGELKDKIRLKGKKVGDFFEYQGMKKQVTFIIHTNPENKILHTVLVGPMNGFIHSLTLGTPLENHAALFNGEPAYIQWIQPDF